MEKFRRAIHRHFAADYSSGNSITVNPAVTIKVQVWDVELPMMPLVMLELAPHLGIYPYSSSSVRASCAPPQPASAIPQWAVASDPSDRDGRAHDTADSGTGMPDPRLPTDVGAELVRPFAVANAPGGSQERFDGRAAVAAVDGAALQSSSLLQLAVSHPSFRDIITRARLRRRADVHRLRSTPKLRAGEGSDMPVFFFHGMRLRRPTDACTPTHSHASIRTVEVRWHGPPFACSLTGPRARLATLVQG